MDLSHPFEPRPRRFGIGLMCALSAVVGVVTGLGALFFRVMISVVHNLFFLQTVSATYDSSLFTPANPWGAWVILVPVAGAVIVTFIVANFAPEAKGHGVPEVMGAIYYKGGVIRPVVAAVKSIASAVAIGSGAAVGREGPIIQIGAALGSTFGQFIRLEAGQRITLVAAGAGAGIAATFNTPIGGVLFVTELMLPEVSVNTFLPVATATSIATFVGRLVFGPAPAFSVPKLASLPNDLGSGAFTLLLYVILGALTGVAAAVFIRGLHLIEDAFDEIPGRYLRHMLGMLIVGVMIYVLFRQFGHYYVEGVGYSTIQSILSGQLTGTGLLALLLACKIAATSISLGSGSSGGVFSPSLYMGATLGGAFASILAQVFGLSVSAPAFAMVGMGAMVGGSTGAAMTAVTMIFEMTRDYDIVLPMILAVGASLAVRRLLSDENIYTAKLIRRGQPVPRGLHANMFLVQKAKDVMETDVPIVPAETRLDEFLHRPEHRGAIRHVVVVRDGRISGVLRINTRIRHQLAQSDTGVTLGEVAQKNFTIVRETAAVFDVITRMSRRGAAMALVVATNGGRVAARPGQIVGIITREHIADSVAKTVEIYSG
ncbi:MAG TPA: chloride channel protein [Lichenihabitans sp.]|nr:chloride channel protein [Lichenihabitans sp.]